MRKLKVRAEAPPTGHQQSESKSIDSSDDFEETKDERVNYTVNDEDSQEDCDLNDWVRDCEGCVPDDPGGIFSSCSTDNDDPGGIFSNCSTDNDDDDDDEYIDGQISDIALED